MIFSYQPQRAYCMLDPREPKLQAIVVQLLGPGSEIILYKKSHRITLVPGQASNGLLEISREKLRDGAVEIVRKDMSDGGLVILDARLSFTVVKGVAITLAFTSKEELARWGKIKLPNSSELRKKCEEMSTERIGTNYEFEGG
ncbi:hypothetical protein M432DRAFT_128055 [Thermoascus aurantiacus ATCC 26904]